MFLNGTREERGERMKGEFRHALIIHSTCIAICFFLFWGSEGKGIEKDNEPSKIP